MHYNSRGILTGVRSSVSSVMTSTFIANHRFWTWREAIEVASRVTNACDRVSVRRDGDQWRVSYRVRPVIMNAAG